MPDEQQLRPLADVLRDDRFVAASSEAKRRILTAYHKQARTEGEKPTREPYAGFTPSHLLGQGWEAVKSIAGFVPGMLAPPSGAAESIAMGIGGPAGVATTRLLEPQIAEAGKAWEAAKGGRPLEAAGRVGAAVLPVLGPIAAGLGEQAGRGDIGGALAQAAVYAAAPKVTGKVAGATSKAGARVFGPIERPRAILSLEAAIDPLEPTARIARLPSKGSIPGRLKLEKGKPVVEVPRLESSVPEIAEAARSQGIKLSERGLEGQLVAGDEAMTRTWDFAMQRLGPIAQQPLVQLRTGTSIPVLNELFKESKKWQPSEALKLQKLGGEIIAGRRISIDSARWMQDLIDKHLYEGGLAASQTPKARALHTLREEIRGEVVKAADEYAKPAQAGQILRTWGDIKEVVNKTGARLIDYAIGESKPWYHRVSGWEAYHAARGALGSPLHAVIAVSRVLTGRGYKVSNVLVKRAWRTLEGERSKLSPATEFKAMEPGAPPQLPPGPGTAPPPGGGGAPPAPPPPPPVLGNAPPQAPPSAPTPPTMRPLSPQAQAQARAAAERATAAAKPSGKPPIVPDWENAVKVYLRGEFGPKGRPSPSMIEAKRLMALVKQGKMPIESVPKEFHQEIMESPFLDAKGRAAKRQATRRETGAAPSSTTVSIDAAGGVESKVIAGKTPQVASTETQLIGEENAVNRAASLIREGKSVKAVFSALTEGLGRNLKPKEFDILTKAVLEKGAESPKK